MKSLVTKLVRVMAQVKRVAKNGRNDFHGYDYVTEADILEAVRENLIKENVFIFSSVEGSHKEGDMTSVRVKSTFVDGDTGETMEVASFGQGADKGDKGANKAITAASKYFLLKNFLIPTGDDPEATTETGAPTSEVKARIGDEAAKPTGSKKYGFSGKTKVAVVSKAATIAAEETSGNIF